MAMTRGADKGRRHAVDQDVVCDIGLGNTLGEHQQREAAHPAHVVDQDVQGAEMVNRLSHHMFNIFANSGIADHGMRHSPAWRMASEVSASCFALRAVTTSRHPSAANAVADALA
jgi:hypothetical protein